MLKISAVYLIGKAEIPIHYTIWPLHRGAFCQFRFRWIYYYGSNKSTGEETGKTHLCALVEQALLMFSLVSRKFLAMRNITLYSVFAQKIKKIHNGKSAI